MTSRLLALCEINHVDIDDLQHSLYRTLVVSIFSIVVKEIEAAEARIDALDGFRNSKDHIRETKRIVLKYTGTKLNDSEANEIYRFLIAYLHKEEYRYPPTNDIKIELLKKQSHKCNICSADIAIQDSELDHIVPHSLVGDRLKNNYQMLCRTCNRRKSASSYFDLLMTFMRRDEGHQD